MTVPSKKAFLQSRYLTWEDVSTDSITKPSLLKVYLKVSKCDQLGKGLDIYVGSTDSNLCPVTEGLAYIACRGSGPEPIFRFVDGTQLTESRFVTAVREALTQAGLDSSLCLGHSFRIGAATSAAQAGIEDSTIKTLGCWSSTTFLVYIRTPKEQLAHFSEALARC